MAVQILDNPKKQMVYYDRVKRLSKKYHFDVEYVTDDILKLDENGYEKNVKDKNEKKSERGLWVKKLMSAGIFVMMLTKVMGIKKPADLAKKLEFVGPATSGNAIKTVYGTLILGRKFFKMNLNVNFLHVFNNI